MTQSRRTGQNYLRFRAQTLLYNQKKMYSLILKITHSAHAKDLIAVGRGLYRVIDGGVSGSKVRRSSWMDDPVQYYPDQQTHRQIKDDPKPVVVQQRKDMHVTSTEPLSVKKIQVDDEPKIIIQAVQKQPISPPISPKKEHLILKQSDKVVNEYHPETSSIPDSRMSRIWEFGKLGFSLASASVFSNSKDESYYQGMADKIAAQLCKMRGAPLKLAQMLSIQEDNLIPPAIRKAFEKARESAHVIPPEEVEFMMKKNLGDNWREKFAKFGDSPFASASIGQVHRGELPTGQEVAVKIQYRAVKKSINSDINNLHLLMKLPKVFPKTMYMERILEKTRQELMQECNYITERTLQQKYQAAMTEALQSESGLFKIPKIFHEYSTGEVLTSEYLTGIKLKDLEDSNNSSDYPQSLKDEVGRRIMLLTFKELFEMGIMQSDPNPSNFTYNWQNDQLNLFDFGATHIYRPEFLQNYYRIIEGSVKGDREQIWEASIKTGFVTGEQNKAMKNGHIESIMITGEPLRYQGKYDFGVQEITKRIYETIPMMLKNRLKPPPEEVYSLHRKLSGSYLACIRLGAKVDCSAIFSGLRFRTIASQPQQKP